MVVNLCGSWGIRTPGTRKCARQFSKLLVSATHPNFQSFGSLTSQHSFSECGCKGKHYSRLHQIFSDVFSKKSFSHRKNAKRKPADGQIPSTGSNCFYRRRQGFGQGEICRRIRQPPWSRTHAVLLREWGKYKVFWQEFNTWGAHLPGYAKRL